MITGTGKARGWPCDIFAQNWYSLLLNRIDYTGRIWLNPYCAGWKSVSQAARSRATIQ